MTKTIKVLQKLIKIASEVLGNGYKFSIDNNPGGNFHVILCNGKIRAHVRKNADKIECLYSVTGALTDELRIGRKEYGAAVWMPVEKEDVFVVAMWIYNKPQYDTAWEVRLKGDEVVLKKTDWAIRPPREEKEEEMSIKDYFTRLVNAMMLIKEVSKDG